MKTGDVIALPGRKRPLAVWILTLTNGILAMLLIATSLVAEDKGYSGIQAAIAGVTGLGVSISAHATWFGYRYGRNILLGLITCFLGLLIVQSVMVIAWALENHYGGLDLDWAIARVVLSIAWLAANYRFLLGRRARAYFLG